MKKMENDLDLQLRSKTVLHIASGGLYDDNNEADHQKIGVLQAVNDSSGLPAIDAIPEE